MGDTVTVGSSTTPKPFVPIFGPGPGVLFNSVPTLHNRRRLFALRVNNCDGPPITQGTVGSVPHVRCVDFRFRYRKDCCWVREIPTEELRGPCARKQVRGPRT